MMRTLILAAALTLAFAAGANGLGRPPGAAPDAAPAAMLLAGNTPAVVKRCTSRGGWRRLRSYYAAGTKCV
jgi:hypothetical protein